MTELVFILDRSGSMSGLEADTIGGFNSMIEKQKKEAGEAVVSTVLFANGSSVIHDRLLLGEVPPLTEKEYFTCGCTALLDAVGGAIHHIGNIHKYARREGVPEELRQECRKRLTPELSEILRRWESGLYNGKVCGRI